ALQDRDGHRRSGGRRSPDRAGTVDRRSRAHARDGARDHHRVRRRAACRTALRKARARPRRPRGVGAAPACRRQTMSDEEGFLARWSRRKRAAESDTRDETNAAETPKVETTAPPAAGDESEVGAAEAAVDPASLPPIESIGPESDIREYLKTGVPAELTRAALRRAWSADPAI